MKKLLCILPLLAASHLCAEDLPEQYNYQIALFNGANQIFSSSGMAAGYGALSKSYNSPYLIKTCDKNGDTTIDTSTAERFHQGVSFSIDTRVATLSFVETIIDESTYAEPKQEEYNLCINTGKPTERKYYYNTSFDLNSSELQEFHFENNRIVKLIVNKQSFN